MTGLVTSTRTALALGLPNIARVIWYRFGVKSGLNPVRRLHATEPKGPMFSESQRAPVLAPPVETWQSSANLFGHLVFNVNLSPPDWLSNPITGQKMAMPHRDWWQIPDFDPAVGDIKLIWELSRMDWVLAFAQRARNGDKEALARLNHWLTDWCTHNPPFRGPNWKCGQEASIRVMHLAMAALVLGQINTPPSGLIEMIHLHLRRIVPTVNYAMAQDNNHGTSEAAALFIGGSWLASQDITEGKGWQQTGRRMLEDRANRLIGKDGSFSQYSLNYHRMMLDTLSMAEVWRRQMDLPAFSEHFLKKASAATHWLRNIVSASNGDGPNVGANDGAQLLQLTNSNYRDHRPTVQLATSLFEGQSAYSQDGNWNHALHWLSLSAPHNVALKPGSFLADDGGFAMLHNGEAMAMLRYPRFRFRPSQADALHLDLWLHGENLLRDAGSYSYNTKAHWLNYFAGTASHNTVQFDARDQMPRISRFLFGDWLKTNFCETLRVDASGSQFAAGYSISRGPTHRRYVTLKPTCLMVTDEISGFERKAILRWRLAPGPWKLAHRSDSVQLTNGVHELSLMASMPIVRCELIDGWESRHYFEKTTTPIIEIEVHQAGEIKTEYRWNPLE